MGGELRSAVGKPIVYIYKKSLKKIRMCLSLKILNKYICACMFKRLHI